MKKHINTITLTFVLLLLLQTIALSQDYRFGCLKEEIMPDWVQPSPPIKLIGLYDESCDNSEHLPPILSQGTQNSCTAWATGYYYKTYQEWQEHNWNVTQTSHQFSPAFIYNLINGGADEGSYISDAFKLLCDLGCANLDDMPYNQSNFTTFPGEDDFYNGMEFRCQQSYNIDLYNDLTDIKNHLLNGNVAVMGINVYQNFMDIGDYDDIYCLSDIYGNELGGHAVTLCGFDDELQTNDGIGAFKLANSWGDDWGNSGGYFWMSYQAVQSNITSQGNAFYSNDLISYSPTLITRFHVDHDDRYAIEYKFGLGEHSSPLWEKPFFNWYQDREEIIPYPANNIVLDLTDGAGFLSQSTPNNMFIGAIYSELIGFYGGEITYFSAEELTGGTSAISPDPPVTISSIFPIYAYADLVLEYEPPPPPPTLWTRTFGGSDWDEGRSVQQTTDGGYIIAGYTQSYGTGGDVYLIKTDANGNEQWSQTYGGSDYDRGNSVQQTSDGGYIIAGWTESYGAGSYDVYLIKTDANGNESWSRTFGGSYDDYGYSIQKTYDGGYIIAGYTESYGAGGYDVYLIKTDANGNEQWSRTFGGSSWDYGRSVHQTSDGGYIIAGNTWSYISDDDVYLIKTNGNGNEEWSRIFGGNDLDGGYSVQQTTDGGYIIAGFTFSYIPWAVVYLIKTDTVGNEQWYQTFGGIYMDIGKSVQQTTDGGYIIAGITHSYGAGSADVYLIKTDENGNETWSQTFGGSSNDRGYSVQQTSDGGYIIAGYTYSYGAGSADVYLIKVGGEIVLTPIDDLNISLSNEDVLLNWSDIPEAVGYHIYRSSVPYFDIGGMTPIANPTTNSFLDMGAAAGGAFFYIVTVEY